MKVKVTKKPKPLYQQNSDLGITTTTNVLTLGKKQIMPEYNETYPEADDDANVNAEVGEVITTPDLKTYKIGGKTHKNGGTDINVEPGSFIFSNHKPLAIKGEVLQNFGISPKSKVAKKGVTPADLAWKYKTGKYVNILNSDEADDLDKQTASKMLGNLQNKLGKIAFIQEAEKGFPEGVPELAIPYFEQAASEDQLTVAKNGGLIKAQSGMEFNGKKYRRVNQKPSEAYKLVHEDDSGSFYDKPGANASFDVPKAIPGGKKTAGWNTAIIDMIKRGATAQQLAARGHGTVEGLKKQFGQYFTSDPDDYVYIPRQSADPIKFNQPLNTGIKGRMAPIRSIPNAASYSQPTANENITVYDDGFEDVGYGAMDAVSMGAALRPIKRFPPVKIAVEAEQQSFRPVDFEAQRQAVKGQVASVAKSNTLISPTSSQASARNSQLLGQSLDTINQSFSQEFNTNQLGYQQVEAQNAQSRQQVNMFNAGQSDQYNVRYAQMNENFDAQKTQRTREFLEAFYNAERTRQIKNASNLLNQDYKVDANGNIIRKQFSQDRAMARLTGDGSLGQTQQNLSEQIEELVQQGYTRTEAMQRIRMEQSQYQEVDKNNDGRIDQVRRNSSRSSLLNVLGMLFDD